jgi:hypothetical protein
MAGFYQTTVCCRQKVIDRVRRDVARNASDYFRLWEYGTAMIT